MALFCGSAVLRGAGRGCCYPPALWRGGSSDAAKLRSEGWGDYACSECATRMTQLCSEQAAPPTPDPSPPLASLAGGGEHRRRAGGTEALPRAFSEFTALSALASFGPVQAALGLY